MTAPDRWRILAGILTATSAAACGALRGYSEGRSGDFVALDASAAGQVWLGVARFTYDDFGGINTDALNTTALPWKVVAAALALDRSRTTGAPLTIALAHDALQEVGFIIPAAIANWPVGPPPRPLERPLGIIRGYARLSFPANYRLEIANLGCAACHAGVTYDDRGTARREVWLGLPNTSLDLEAFTQAVYRALGWATGDPRRLVGAIRTLFPETDLLELVSIQELLLPRLRRRLAELRATIDAPAPYILGAPGLMNGVGTLKRQFGLLSPDALHREVAFNSIPDLGDVLLRSSLLADGSFAPPGAARFTPRSIEQATERHLRDLAGLAAFFTVPTMGNHPSRAERAIPAVTDVFQFLRAYRPPRFPGPIDRELAREGQTLYDARCAECHGTYSRSLSEPRLQSFPNRPVALYHISTDPARQVLDTALLHRMQASAYARHVSMGSVNGYVASRLSGLWATAPYLHNGSVPTLWHLMHPELRPARFFVGGHRLDFRKVGIDGVLDEGGTWRYPAEYTPWSRPSLYDTSRPGLGNGGHAREFAGLSEAQKLALLEYLKLL